MSASQNGYSCDPGLIAKYTVLGAGVKLNLRKGDTSVLLLHLAAWFHRNISPLKQAQCGGYNDRNIRGSSKTKSNHASGTAEDLNWTEFPQHSRRMTAAQRAKVHEHLKYYEGAIRWGGDYSDPDEQHFEINASPGKVTAVANKIRRDAQPVKTVEKQVMTVAVPNIGEGDDDARLSGYNAIVRIQHIVNATPDGVWGPKTTAAIAAMTRRTPAQCRRFDESLFRQVYGLDAK